MNPHRLRIMAWRIAACLPAMLALPSWGAGPVPLGRLFTTPQQRAQLDAQRLSALLPATPDAPAQVPAAPPAPSLPPPPLVLNGVLTPAAGKATVWLDQEPVPEARRIVRRDGKITITLPSGQQVTLKPGQRYDETTAEVRDDSQ